MLLAHIGPQTLAHQFSQWCRTHRVWFMSGWGDWADFQHQLGESYQGSKTKPLSMRTLRTCHLMNSDRKTRKLSKSGSKSMPWYGIKRMLCTLYLRDLWAIGAYAALCIFPKTQIGKDWRIHRFQHVPTVLKRLQEKLMWELLASWMPWGE